MLPIMADLLGHFGTIMKKSKQRKKENIKAFNISMKCHKLACIKTVLELKNELKIYQAQYTPRFSVMRAESDTFGDPIFQEGLQN